MAEGTSAVARPFSDPIEARIATALIDVIAERGYREAELAAVIARAGVEEAEFRRRFADKEDCTLKVFEAYIDDFRAKVTAAYEAHASWRPALRAAAYAAASWIAVQPRTARFGVVDILEVQGELIRIRREEIFQYCAGLIDAGRAEAADPAAIPESAAIVAIGSIAQTLTQRYHSGEDFDPIRVVPELMYIAVRPYLGPEAALEELSIPPPPQQVGEEGG